MSDETLEKALSNARGLTSVLAELVGQLQASTNPRPNPPLVTIDRFSADNPTWTEASVRWKWFNAPANGFGEAFVKDGRRVLVNPPKFYEVVMRQGGQT